MQSMMRASAKNAPLCDLANPLAFDNDTCALEQLGRSPIEDAAIAEDGNHLGARIQ